MKESSPIGSVAMLVAALGVAALGVERPASHRASIPTGERTSAPHRDASPTLRGPLDLNTATAGELEALPRVGPALAARIVEHRHQHGPFVTLDDLDAVKGVGPRLLQRLRPLLRLGGPPPQNRSNTNPQRNTSESSIRPASDSAPAP